MKMIIKMFKWYLIDKIFITFYIPLSIFTGFILYPFLGSDQFDGLFMYVTEFLFVPLLTLLVGIEVIRNPPMNIFEINIVGSLRKLFLYRLVTVLFGLSIPFLMLGGLVYLGGRDDLIIPLFLKLMYLLMILSMVFQVGQVRYGYLFLTIFIFIIPFAPVSFLNIVRLYGERLDPLLSIIIYTLFPAGGYLYKDTFSMNVLDLQSFSLIIYAIILVSSYIIHLRREYPL